MAEQKTIYCPKCGRKTAHWDGKSSIDVVSVCRKCDKQVIYRVATGKTEIKDRKPRPSSNGMNFSC